MKQIKKEKHSHKTFYEGVQCKECISEAVKQANKIQKETVQGALMTKIECDCVIVRGNCKEPHNLLLPHPQDSWEERFNKEFPYDVYVFRDGNEPRAKKIKEFIQSLLLSAKQETLNEVLEELPKEKTSLDGKDLPFENSPEIYGNQRIEAFKKGYNNCLSKVKNIIKNKLK